MNPLIRKALSTAAIIGVTAAVTSTVVSQMNEEGMPSHDEMMEVWMKLGMPGPEHERMASHVGKWDQKHTYWMFPGADATHSSAKSEVKSLFDGRYLVEKVQGKHPMPDGTEVDSEGLGIFGFDNQKQKHFFCWFSNMSTNFMYGEGDADATGKTITYYSEMDDPMSGTPLKFKTVSTELAPNEFEMWMYMEMGGEWHKHMHIVSMRH